MQKAEQKINNFYDNIPSHKDIINLIDKEIPMNFVPDIMLDKFGHFLF